MKRKRVPLADMPVMVNDILLRAARGEVVERVPVWMMRQAGRYLPEFRAEREKNDFFAICRSPELACKVTLQPLQRFEKLDALIIFSDILVIPQAMGMDVSIVKGKGPVFANRLSSPADMALLDMRPDVRKHLAYVYDAINLTRVKACGKAPLIGFCGAPWTVMAYMVEGGSSRTLHNAKAWLFHHPAESHALLSAIADTSIDYLVEQAKAGAQMLQVFESWGGQLDPDCFSEFSLPYTARICCSVKSRLKELGIAGVPVSLFAKGTNHSLEDISKSGFDVISVDWNIDPREARRATGGRVTLQGNLDPGYLYAPPEVLRKRVKIMCQRFGKQRYIANLGWGMQPFMAPEMAEAFIDAVHSFNNCF